MTDLQVEQHFLQRPGQIANLHLIIINHFGTHGSTGFFNLTAATHRLGRFAESRRLGLCFCRRHTGREGDRHLLKRKQRISRISCQNFPRIGQVKDRKAARYLNRPSDLANRKLLDCLTQRVGELCRPNPTKITANNRC